MGFAVVHMQKIKVGSTRGIQSHVNREHPPKTNPDIDNSKTAENYDLLPQSNFSRYIKGVIENFATETKTVRKDAVVMCSFVVTSDEQTMKAMLPEKQQNFFKDSLRFFADRYGNENIVNATVHMDENTPHLHLGVVPITDDGRLSAKSLFDKKELKSLQTDFALKVGSVYGLERGQENSERKHLSENRFKAVKAAEEAEKLQHNIEAMKQEKSALQGEIEHLRDTGTQLNTIIKQYNESLKENPKAKLFIEERLKQIKQGKALNYIERKGLSKEFEYFVSHSERLPEEIRESPMKHKNLDLDRDR